jgi:small subunit ribosomal protein S6
MRRYETMMVLHPELPEAQTRETIERAKRLLEGMGAEIHEINEWGMRDLAYSIRKVKRGYYVVADYSAQPAAVNELERTLKLSDEILRYMTVARSQTRRRASAAVARPHEDRRQAGEGAAVRAESRMSGETPVKASEDASSGTRVGSAGPGSQVESDKGEWSVEEADAPTGDSEEDTP